MATCMSFVILKLNGVDVTNTPQDEVLQLFLSSPEPILVELKRRPYIKSLNTANLCEDHINRNSTSTKKPNAPPQDIEILRSNKEFTTAAVQTDSDLYLNSQESDGCLPSPDMDIEEVVLHKSGSEDQLGLTVSYSSDDADMFTEVYISNITPDSIAARDGRLRQGDQILQVNGRDVSNKEDTESLIAENKSAVTLLVSRYLYEDDDFLDSLIENEILPYETEDANVQATSSIQTTTDNLRKTQSLSLKPSNSFCISQKNDPLNHDNIRAHLESVNQEILVLNNRMENVLKLSTSLSKDPQSRQGIRDETKDSCVNPEIEHIYETIPEYAEMEPIYCTPYESDKNIVEQWLRLKQKIQNYPKEEPLPNQSLNNSSNEEHETTSSAYNTGGSVTSNQLTLEFDGTNKSSFLFCSNKCQCHNSQMPSLPESGVKTSISAPTLPADTMYTNVANLHQTMLLQQRLFRQALTNQLTFGSTMGSENCTPIGNLSPKKRFTAPNLSQYQFVGSRQVVNTTSNTTMPPSSEDKMEWKVKRRQDGTRYIVRRPIRSPQHVKRAEERQPSQDLTTTTEDDTISEVKIGRYWNKVERKKHLEKSRERRYQRQLQDPDRHNKLKSQQPQIADVRQCGTLGEVDQLMIMRQKRQVSKKRTNGKCDLVTTSAGECGATPAAGLFSVTTV